MGGFVNSLIMKDLSDNDMRYKYEYYNRDLVEVVTIIATFSQIFCAIESNNKNDKSK